LVKKRCAGAYSVTVGKVENSLFQKIKENNFVEIIASCFGNIAGIKLRNRLL
jgi:hypothetical protein